MITIQNINFYTVDEIAEILKITPYTVRVYIRQNKITAQRIGRPYLISEEALNEFLQPAKNGTKQVEEANK